MQNVLCRTRPSVNLPILSQGTEPSFVWSTKSFAAAGEPRGLPGHLCALLGALLQTVRATVVSRPNIANYGRMHTLWGSQLSLCASLSFCLSVSLGSLGTVLDAEGRSTLLCGSVPTKESELRPGAPAGYTPGAHDVASEPCTGIPCAVLWTYPGLTTA